MLVAVNVLVVVMSAPAVSAVFQGLVPVRRAASMDEAVREAYDMAPAEGTVILAPACASQDMFRDYRDRGDRFAAAVRALAGTKPHRSAAGPSRTAHG